MKKIISLLCVFIAAATLLCSCSAGGDTALEYKGSKLNEAMYGYWVATYKTNILYYYNNKQDTAEFWSSELTDGQTTEQYFSDVVNSQIYKFLIGQKLFDEYGLKLDSSVKQSIDDDINEKLELYGSRAELNSELADLGLNIDLLKDIYTCEEKLNAVYDYLYGDNGVEALTEDDYRSYYESNYCLMKYIVIFTTKLSADEEGNYLYDDDGNLITEAMTEEELAAQKAKAAEALAAAEAGGDFDELISQYSEYDTTAYPNGFYVSANDISSYGSGIISELFKLEENGIGRVDEDYAVYIIKKYPLIDWSSLNTDDLSQLTDLESYAVEQVYNAKFTELAKDIVVHEDIVAKYKLSEIAMNAHSNF